MFLKVSLRIVVVVLFAVYGSVVLTAPAGADPPSPASTPPAVITQVPAADAGAVAQFEENAVQEVLQDHDLPSSDANAVLGWGRDDVRAQEWSDLVAIMSKDSSQRTTNEAAVYDWFAAVVQKQQIVAAQGAVAEYLKWSGHSDINDGSNPQNFGPNGSGYCNYEPPGGESGPFGGTYTDNRDQDCFTPCTDFVTECMPAYPTVQEFEQWGLYDAAQDQDSSPGFYTATVGTAVAMGVGFTAALAGSLLSIPLTTAIDASALAGTQLQTDLFPFAARVSYTAIQALRGAGNATEVAAEVTTDAAEASAGAEVASSIAFVAGIVLFFVITTVLATITIVQNAGVHTSLANALKGAQDNLPDLTAMVSDDSEYTGLYATFITTTLPEADIDCTGIAVNEQCANAPTPPAPSPSDSDFLVTANGHTGPQREIYSTDPAGYDNNTYLSGNGWFVSQKFDPNDPANAATPTHGGGIRQSLSFPYTDWAGNHWIAERVTVNGQPEFAITPVDDGNEDACHIPNATGTPCITPTIQFQEPNGAGEPINASATIVSAQTAGPAGYVEVSEPVSVGQPFTLHAVSTGSGSDQYSWWLPSTLGPDGTTCVTPAPAEVGCVTQQEGSQANLTLWHPGRFIGELIITDPQSHLSDTEEFSVVAMAPTTTSVTSSAAAAVWGQPITLTASVESTPPVEGLSANYPEPGGDVQFTLDGAPIGGPVPLNTPAQPCLSCASVTSTASITLPHPMLTGTDGVQVSADYLGSADYHASTTGADGLTQRIGPAATTTTLITASTDPTVTGQPVILNAAVAPIAPGGGLPTGTVQFRYDGADVGDPIPLSADGTAASPPITTTHANPLGGTTGIITALYSGDPGFTASSGQLAPTVATDPTVLTLASSANPIHAGEPVTFTATVTAAPPGSGTPAGSVRFDVDGGPTGEAVPVDHAGHAALVVADLAPTGPGTPYPQGHSISATFEGTNCSGCPANYGPSAATFDSDRAGQQVTAATTPPGPGGFKGSGPSAGASPASGGSDVTTATGASSVDLAQTGPTVPISGGLGYGLGAIMIGLLLAGLARRRRPRHW